MRARRSPLRTSCTLVPLAALTLAFSSPAAAASIPGRVFNRTLSRPVPDCPVTLIRHGAQTAVTAQDTTDADGRFRFDAPLPAGDEHLILSAAYASVDYFHPVDGGSGESVEISVYETTGADTAIALASHHIIVDAAAGEVSQILIVQNNGDRTYISGNGHGLEVPLPEGVTDITRGSQNLHTHGPILIDPRPVQPGGSHLMFVHPMPVTQRLVQEVRYPTGSVDILVAPSDTPISESSLQDLGEASVSDGRNFRRLSTTALKPGDRIVLQIGSPALLGEWISRETLIWGTGTLAVAFALLAVFFRPRQKAEIPTDLSGQGGTGLEVRRTAMLEQIADLDDRFADGELPEADYRARRNALKAEIVRLTRALDSTGA